MDQLTCKCGARTCDQHLASGKPVHTYKPDKASSQVRAARAITSYRS